MLWKYILMKCGPFLFDERWVQIPTGKQPIFCTENAQYTIIRNGIEYISVLAIFVETHSIWIDGDLGLIYESFEWAHYKNSVRDSGFLTVSLKLSTTDGFVGRLFFSLLLSGGAFFFFFTSQSKRWKWTWNQYINHKNCITLYIHFACDEQWIVHIFVVNESSRLWIFDSSW